MGRKKKKISDLKVRFGVSLCPNINSILISKKINKSKLIEDLLKKYLSDQKML